MKRRLVLILTWYAMHPFNLEDMILILLDILQSQTSSNTLAKMRRVPWTATHAFFADMGGMRLRCPDFPDFPVNTVHLLWLFKNGHIEYPEVEEETIKDKNKADTLARVITMLQVGWFTVQLIARGIQGLCITSLELSTLGFVCCALNIFWFWRKKPLDVVEPITIQCKGSLISIVRDAIATEKDGWQYTQTPLDCLDRESGTSYVRSFFYSMSYAVNVERKAHTFPATSIPNSAVSHTGCKRLDVVYGYFFGMLYFGIHFAGWNFHFPSTIESWLWRSSAITLACIAAMFEFVCSPGNRLGRYLPGKPTTGIGILKLLPKTLALLCLWPLIVTYFLARSYIIVEGFAGLRALPESAFQTINWWNFVPHI